MFGVGVGFEFDVAIFEDAFQRGEHGFFIVDDEALEGEV